MGPRQKAVLCGAVVAGIATAYAVADPTNAELQSQVDQLKSQVDARSHGPEISPAQVDETVKSVLSDANDRSKLLAVEGFTGGWDNGFKLASSDGNYLMQFGLLWQAGYIAQTRQDVKNDNHDDTQDGFSIRRTQLILTGNAITKDLTYRIMFNGDKNSGDVILRDAYAQYKFADNYAIKFGQFRDIPWHEEIVGDARQLAIAPSVVNGLLGGSNADRIQGVAVSYSKDALNTAMAFHDGANSKNTNFENTPTVKLSSGDTDFGISGRAEYFFSDLKGRKAYEDQTALGTTEDLLVLGGGFDFTQSGSNDVLFHTIDLQYENPNGLGLYFAYLGAEINGNANEAYDYGALAQVSYLLNKTFEVFGRYSYTKFDEAPAGFHDDVHEVCVGVNKYFDSHHAKLTVDATWLPNGCPSAISTSEILASENDELMLRAQFQLYL